MHPCDRDRSRRAGRVLILAGVPQGVLRAVGVTALASIGILLPSCGDHNVVIKTPLTCDAAPEFTEGPLALEVCFVEAVTGGTAPYSYNWAFGDGESTTDQDPCHTYQDLGTYTAILTVSDAADHDCQVINLSVEAGLLKCSLEATPSSGPVPLGVVWQGSASQGRPPYTMTLNGTISNIGDTVMQAVIYDQPGQYGKTFTVEDSDGTTCEETVDVSVND
jgi:PKD repeat protein